jgi:hypothetical protein
MATCPRCGQYERFEDDAVVCIECIKTNRKPLLAQDDEEDFFPQEDTLPSLEPAFPPAGLIAECADYLTRATMTPPEFALAISLFNVSAILCGQVTIALGDNQWPPALWPVLVADPAGLKSAALRSGTRLLDDATGGSLRLAEDFTPEALHAALTDQPQGYIEHSEFGAFVNAVRRKDYLGGAFDFMNRVYDGETAWSLRKGQGLTKAQRVAVAMLSGTTWTALKTWVRADLLMEGFLTRPLYVPQVSKSVYVGLKSEDPQPLPDRRNHIIRGLAELHKGARYTAAPTVRFDEVAAGMWNMKDEPYDQDWESLQGELLQLISDGRDVLDSTKFLSGTGTNEPVGLLNIGGTGSLTTTQRVQTDVAATLDVDDVWDVKGNITNTRFAANATFLANSAMFDRIYRFTPSGSTTEPQAMPTREGPLCGYPKRDWSDMVNTTTTGSNVLLVGAFQNFLIADHLGMTVEIIPHLFGATNRFPTGQRGLYAYWRTGTVVAVPNAFRYLEVL